MSKRLMPTYLVNFLKKIYDGTIPSNFGKRMVSRQFIARVKELYETLGGANPSDYSRRMVNEYLIKFFNEIEIVEYTDDDVKMTKTISSDLVYPACRIDAIGGMSYKCNNLIDTTKLFDCYIDTNGIEVSSTSDKTTDYILISSTDVTMSIVAKVTQANVAFRVAEYDKDKTFIQRDLSVKNLTADQVQSATFTLDTSCRYVRFMFNLSQYGDVNTWMGNVGTTALPYEPYFTGIRDSAVTAVKTYNTDNELLDTYTVPSAITSLEGYGQSNPDDPTVLNIVDFVAGKYYEKGYIDNGVWVSKVAEISITEQAPLLAVEEGGTIVFENEYNQNMSNEVTTWIKEN